MKILIITNHSYMLYQFRKELISMLVEEGHDVTISTPFVGHEDDLRDLGTKLINTEVDRRGINPKTDLKLMNTYKNIINEIHPDKVITYSIKPNIYAGLVCRIKQIPYYINVQGLGTAFQKEPLATIVSMMYKVALKKAKVVFFENQGNAQVFIDRKIIKKDKIKVLNGAGVNLEKYQYNEYPEHKEIHFLYLGRIMKEKGVEELFEAFERLNSEYKNTKLDIVGFYEDEYESKVNELVNQGIAYYHGFQSDPVPYYEKVDCVVLPSYHEGMSNVLLEASSIGRPIITSNIHGCLEAVVNNKSGYLVNVQDSNDLYLKMKQFYLLTQEEKVNMGKEGRKFMEEQFDKKKVVQETIKKIME